MQSELKKAKIRQERRVKRNRKALIRSERPRLSVNRSLTNLYAQIIDDRESKTVVGLSTACKDLKTIKDRKERAKKAGAMLAKLALAKGVEKVVFDRGHCKFHGRIAAFAEGAREAGLVF
ncbi:MAG: 50S ribosomal protein L18 [Chlamydiia bacterium]|nr:50S ribosomal protein L18 [Chlamydiia bacterium]MCH9618495.1 50S ribosomal protein L18 [Chlamydiia bacterium]MCH9623784.1 50S ribosomal protein L18 [Chlamydiia bacterium]